MYDSTLFLLNLVQEVTGDLGPILCLVSVAEMGFDVGLSVSRRVP